MTYFPLRLWLIVIPLFGWWSMIAQTIYLSADNFDIYRFDLASCTTELVTTVSVQTSDVALYPDGRLLALAASGPLFEIDLDSADENAHFGVYPHPDFVGEIEGWQVYNRWGQLIFSSAQPADEAGFWDGTVDGEPAPMDVYVYRVVWTDESGRSRQTAGDVTLVR